MDTNCLYVTGLTFFGEL